MSRTKLNTKIYVILVLGLLFLSIASSANAWGRRRGVYYRPLSDWTENNPRVIYGLTTNWDLLPDGYILIPTIENSDQYSGYIREKVLDDGRAEVTIYVFGKGCPILVYTLQDAFFNPEPQELLVDTRYYCIYTMQFIFPESNQEIPFFFDILFDMTGELGEWVSTHSIGFGFGTFTDYAENFGFTSGETGKVFLHQESHIDSEGQEVWPYETINVF